MAVRVGFEPTEPFQARIFSKDVLSTTQPPDRFESRNFSPLLMRILRGRQRIRETIIPGGVREATRDQSIDAPWGWAVHDHSAMVDSAKFSIPFNEPPLACPWLWEADSGWAVLAMPRPRVNLPDRALQAIFGEASVGR